MQTNDILGDIRW